MQRGITLCLLTVCCSMIGFLKAGHEDGRLKDLKIWYRITLLLQSEISYKRTPLPEAFTDIAGKVEEPYRRFLLEVSGEMRQMRDAPLSVIFSENVERYLADTCLNGEERKRLMELGADLGFLDKQMQLDTLESFRLEYRSKIDELQQQLPVKKKLYRSLGVMGGLFLAVLFL
ncbi:MAG: stage III sporulation protein AB [Lachnospiraceae bacterium]|nr:stage III sporulation protein AB [Lachnospiraceae bacterium]